MKKRQSLARLTALSDVILDQHLAKLQACAAERNASLQRLRDLAPAPAEGLDPITGAATLLRFEIWADARRSEINLVLARQTAAWMEAQAEAKTAFGRAQVLKRLQQVKRK
jgi:hypothetical protein